MQKQEGKEKPNKLARTTNASDFRNELYLEFKRFPD